MMLPYVFMVCIPAVISICGLANKKTDKINRLVIDSFFSIWLILLLLRGMTVGTDIMNYRAAYSLISNIPISRLITLKNIFTPDVEIGFCLLIKIVHGLGLNFKWFLAVVSIISLIPIWKLYRENSREYPFLSIVLLLSIGLFGIYFSALRQVIAMAFAYPCYKYAKENKLIGFIVTVFAAFLFHASAILLLVLYPVYNFKPKSKHGLLISLLLLLLVFIFRIQIFKIVVNVSPISFSDTISNTGAFSTLILLVLFIVYSFTAADEKNVGLDVVGLRNILIFSAFIQIFASVNYIAMRANYYFLMFIPLTIPKIAYHANNKSKTIAQISIIIMVLFFTGYYFYKAFTGENIMGIYPYVPFWKGSTF